MIGKVKVFRSGGYDPGPSDNIEVLNKKKAKTMTHELANHIESSSSRCTEATLKAFGINGCIPKFASGCLQWLTLSKYKIIKLEYTPKTLKDFKYDLTKSYFINTRGHAMALIQGILIDTEKKGFDNRKIDWIWEVSKK